MAFLLSDYKKEIVSKKGKKILIRSLTPEDYLEFNDFIASFSKEKSPANKNISTFKGDLSFVQSEFDKILQNEAIHLVALHNLKIVGGCRIQKNFGPYSRIGSLGIAIRKGYRGEGIGTALLNEGINLSRRLELNIITLEVLSKNKRAINFYKKNGFTDYGFLPKGMFLSGRYFDVVYMFKNIKIKTKGKNKKE